MPEVRQIRLLYIIQKGVPMPSKFRTPFLCQTLLTLAILHCNAFAQSPPTSPPSPSAVTSASTPNHPATGCAKQAVRYTISHAGDNLFDVNVEFELSSGNLDLDWRPAKGTKDGTVDFISDLQVRDEHGKWRSPNYAQEGTWTFPEAEHVRYDALRYRLTAAHDKASWDIGKEEIAYRFDDAFYFVGAAVLIANGVWGHCDFHLGFKTPPNWRTVAPWPAAADGGFNVHGVKDLLRNLFVVGPGLQTHKLQLAGMDVEILEQKSLRNAAPVFHSLLSKSLGRYLEIFGSAPIKRYVVVFGEDNANDGGAFAQSFGQRMPAPLREFEKIMWARTLAHETLHNWLGITIRPEQRADLQWFTEGGTDYLTMKTLYRVGEIDENDLIFSLEGQLRRFMLGRTSSGPLNLRQAGEKKQQNRQLVYGGGALFHLFLDASMSAKQGPGSYEKLMRKLYADSAKPYSFARLMGVLDAESDGAASEIFAFLNAPFDPDTVMARMQKIGLPTSAFGPDEILVRFAANTCTGSREAKCVPGFLAH